MNDQRIYSWACPACSVTCGRVAIRIRPCAEAVIGPESAGDRMAFAHQLPARCIHCEAIAPWGDYCLSLPRASA